MKTLFNNLLLNHRFIFQDAQKSQPTETEAPKAEKTETKEQKLARERDETFDQLLKNVEQRDKALSGVRKVVDKTEEVGGVEKDKTKKQVAKMDIDKYLEKPGSEKNPVKLETMYVAGKVDKGEKGKVTKLGETKISVPKNDPNILEGQRYQKILADVTNQLQKAEAEGSKAYFEKYVQLSDKAKNRPLLKDAMAEYRAKNAETVKNNLTAALNASKKGEKVEVAKAEPGSKNLREKAQEARKVVAEKTEGTEVVYKFTEQQDKQVVAAAVSFYTKLDAGNHLEYALQQAGEKIKPGDFYVSMLDARAKAPFDKSTDFINKEGRNAKMLAEQAYNARQTNTPEAYKTVASMAKGMLERIRNFKV